MGRCWWKSSFYWKKMSRTWPKIQYFKNFDHKIAIFFWYENFPNITKWQYFLDELNLKFKSKTRGDLTEEWAMIPVTKKHQNILPESQLVTKKHRRFFDVFSWQTENRGDVTKNSDFLLEKMVVHGQFLSTSIKLTRCDDSHSLINFKIVVSLVV